MYIALSLFVFAVGAILKYAVTDRVSDVNLAEIGLILMMIGIAGLIFSVIAEVMQRNKRTQRTVQQDQGQLHEEIRHS